MHNRRRAREIALKVLYGLDVAGGDEDEALSLFWEIHQPVKKGGGEEEEKVRSFAGLLVRGAWRNRRDLDELIGRFSEHWSVGRMSRVDRSILRMAAFELLHCQDIPPKVTINEAIDLGKTYGSENSGAFINGILDALYNQHKAAP
ncbi:MAG TPA: transcription antitermination factor NusB [Syntrophales bacterium]|nr:transcription antitermination factor NusB [Syntrophales bacterium]HOM07937.1 transcription antitermination factor NusB [Syntrophales bacterium]HOO00335.1 transcription antitermination factor NusB [Syntrophales bacterium]HPC01711.1 transcription antitermination factor NusB [Syntrophales bacterium]HPQ06613.1 transcription antitermination factor NusB [Syntrophales bacterium]